MRQSSTRRVRTVATLAAAALLLSAFPAFANESGSPELLPQAPAKFDASAFDGDRVASGKLLVTTHVAGDTSWAASVSADATQIASRVQTVTVSDGEEAEVGAQIAAQAGVAAVEPVRLAETLEVPNDELYDEQWAHQQTNAEAGWDITTGSSDVSVVIADTGVDSTHPDMEGRIAAQFKADEGQIVDGEAQNDDTLVTGHGTGVAGVTGAATDNEIGIAAVDWAADLVDIDVFSDVGGEELAYWDDVIAAVSWAGENDQTAINLSLGGPVPREEGCDAAMQAAIDDAVAAGTSVVIANGNEQETHPDLVSTPANCDGVIAVGATSADDSIASYSYQNEFVTVAAPGGDGDLWSTMNVNADLGQGEEYFGWSGTSFAAPYVTGIISLIEAHVPGLSPADMTEILTESAVHPDGEDRDDVFGHGIVDVAAALEHAEEFESEPDDPRRLYSGDDETNPVDQAVAASQAAFGSGEALHGVIARDDDYADALSGSTLTLGVAPVLYTGSEGGLPDATAEELTRVLDEGSDVFVLGGADAVADESVTDLEELGYNVERLDGLSRGETAEAVSAKVVEIIEELAEGLEVEGVVLAKAFDWPDAITAGSLGTQLGYPVLLTGYGEDQVDELHESAARALEAIDPEFLITVGGAGAVGEEAEREAADIGDVPEENIIRLGGGSRLETAIEVGDFLNDIFAEFELEPVAYGVNVRAQEGYAHVLSASANLVQGGGGFYVPFEGDDGSRYTDDDTTFVREWVQTLDVGDAYAVGGPDVIVDDAVDAFFSDLGLE